MKELVKVIAELVNARLGIVDIKTIYDSISTVINVVVTDTVIGCTCVDDSEHIININDIVDIRYKVNN